MKASTSRSRRSSPRSVDIQLVERAELLEVVRSLLAQPTAPFYEDAVRDEIISQLKQCPHVRTERDRFGNLIAYYRRKTRSAPKWAFAAHMDHPGWVRAKNGKFQFLGSVAELYLARPRMKEFGEFAMWDLPAFEFKDGEIHSRACDDLLGCAEIICLFRELEAKKADVHCAGLFTRAEEVGFVGAINLAQSKILSPRTTIFSLETSTPRGSAKIGSGPIIRVGDRISMFDGAATARLLQLAQAAEIPVQRCLLDGGTCEATAYQLYGFTCVAASLALGNYHNCAPGGTIAPEFVSFDDYANMVRLCVAAALSDSQAPDPSRLLRKKLEKNAQSFRPFYRQLR
jgi:putative aminopeptidase FrvX